MEELNKAINIFNEKMKAKDEEEENETFKENLIKFEKDILKRYIDKKVKTNRDFGYVTNFIKYIQKRINSSRYTQEHKIEKINKVIKKICSIDF